jgi:hypothetical protein
MPPTMEPKQIFLGAALGAVLLFAGPALAAERACIPGVQVECSCLGGSKAVQVCAPDGASFLPCQCATSGPPPVAPAYGAPPYGAAPPQAYGAPPPGAAPAPIAGDAALDVTAAAPATIILDGGEVGRAPMRLSPISPGTHLVRIRFDSGGEEARKVRVLPGQVTAVTFGEDAGAHRRGLKHAFSASLGVISQEDHPGFGVAPEYALNIGISRAFEIRFGVRGLFGPAERGFVSMFGVPFSARLNLGQTYAIGLGGYFGFRSAKAQDWEGENDPTRDIPRPTETGAFAGPEVFPAILRLGPKKQLELFLSAAYLAALSTSADSAYDVVSITLGATFLLL